MASMLDFRFLDDGRGGVAKRKRGREEEGEGQGEGRQVVSQMDGPAAKRSAVAMEEDSARPVFARPTYDGVIAGRVSGRNWKTPKTSRASSMKVKGGKPLSLEQKEREREVKRAYKQRVAELKEEIRLSKVEKRKAGEERKKRKEENVLKTGTKLQKITNQSKLKKMSKKQKSKLQVVSE